MALHHQMIATLRNAKETLSEVKALAERNKGTRMRDVLVLEALALECVIKRVERSDSPAPADAAELKEQLIRLRRIAGIGASASDRTI